MDTYVLVKKTHEDKVVDGHMVRVYHYENVLVESMVSYR